jgi:hypothetical protein
MLTLAAWTLFLLTRASCASLAAPFSGCVYEAAFPMELSPARFVTRDEALRSTLRQLSSHSQPFLVSGPPGVGKTALARAILAGWGAGDRELPRRLSARELLNDTALMALIRLARQRPVLLEDVDQLSGRSEARLADALGRGGTLRLVMTVRCDAAELAPQVSERRELVAGDVSPCGGAAIGRQLPVETLRRCSSSGGRVTDASSPGRISPAPGLLAALASLPVASLRRVTVPSLAARRSDIVLLAEHFCPRGLAIEPAAAAVLTAAAWPDNVKGLRAVLRVAAWRARQRGERSLGVSVLASLLGSDAGASALVGGGLVELIAAWEEGETFAGLSLKRSLRLIEAALLARAVAAARGRITVAARLLGTPPSTLTSRLAALAPELGVAMRWLS